MERDGPVRPPPLTPVQTVHNTSAPCFRPTLQMNQRSHSVLKTVWERSPLIKISVGAPVHPAPVEIYHRLYIFPCARLIVLDLCSSSVGLTLLQRAVKTALGVALITALERATLVLAGSD